MPKRLFFLLIFFLAVFFFSPKIVFAGDCTDYIVEPPSPIPENLSSIKITVRNVNVTDSQGKPAKYRLAIASGGVFGISANNVYSNDIVKNPVTPNSDGTVTFNVSKDDKSCPTSGQLNGCVDGPSFLSHGAKNVHLDLGDNLFCGNILYSVGYDYKQCLPYKSPSDPKDKEQIILGLTNAPSGNYALCVDSKLAGNVTVNNNGIMDGTGITVGPYNYNTTHQFWFESIKQDGQCSPPAPAPYNYLCKDSFSVSPQSTTTPRTPVPFSQEAAAVNSSSLNYGQYDCHLNNNTVGVCNSASGITCDTPAGAGTGILTAIGCIPTDPPQLISGVLKFATGISGGIALLMMAFGAIGMITSAGNAEALKNAQQRFYNAIIGLMLIILSVFLLQLIGVDILKIPGFGR